MVCLGVILAGGRSRRMGGGDKFLHQLSGASLIDRVRQRLGPQVDCLAVSARRRSKLYDLEMLVIEDQLVDAGPLGGIHSTLLWAGSALGQDTLVLSVPADTPFIPSDLASRLSSAREGEDAEIAVASSMGRAHHAVALWPATLGLRLDQWLRDQDRRSIGEFLSQRRIVQVTFHEKPDPFFNVNTPEDMTQAEMRAKAVESGKS